MLELRLEAGRSADACQRLRVGQARDLALALGPSIHCAYRFTERDAEPQRSLQRKNFPRGTIRCDGYVRIATGNGATTRGDEVVQLELQRVVAPHAAPDGQCFECLVGAETREVAAMPLVRCTLGSRALLPELLGRVFVDAQV